VDITTGDFVYGDFVPGNCHVQWTGNLKNGNFVMCNNRGCALNELDFDLIKQ
jgi:hypothetical protein